MKKMTDITRILVILGATLTHDASEKGKLTGADPENPERGGRRN